MAALRAGAPRPNYVPTLAPKVMSSSSSCVNDSGIPSAMPGHLPLGPFRGHG
jgi:hypothetical protein